MSDSATIGNRYLLDRLLGSGGMGAVYGATDTETGEVVAVKLMGLGGHEGYDRARARFVREARTLQGLRHPAVVRYIDHGVQDDQPFLVMEWLPGRSLSAVLDDRGLTPAETLALATRVAGALAFLDSRGVVHRDLKPSNLMLVGDRPERATLVNFGIARGEFGSLTQTGHLVGTPFYMSPEQIHTPRDIDGRADVFALGAILYECVTGQLPFPARDVISFLARIRGGDAVPTSVLRPELPGSLAGLVNRLLNRRRDQRPRAGGELEAALTAVSADLDELARLPAVPRAPRAPADVAAPPRAPASSPTETALKSAAWSRRARLPLYGRNREIDDARAAIAAPGGGVVLWGLPGIGKSRLADEVCAVFVDEQPGVRAQLVLDFQEANGSDDAVRLLCAQLGTRAHAAASLGDLLLRLGRVLRARGEPVVVIDGVEAVPDFASELVAAWRTPDVGARFVVTARERLQIRDLEQLELGPLSWRSQTGETPPAIAFLLDRAGAPSQAPGSDELAAAARIAEALDGNPLALELAADRLRVTGLTDHADTVSALELLAGPATSDSNPLLQALTDAWSRLGSHEQRALAECTLFRGGFTARAASAVLTDVPGVAPLDLLGRLRDAALLATEPQRDGGVRLRVPRTVREFAAPRLTGFGDAETARARRNQYFIEYGGQLADEYNHSGATRPLVRLAAESENLLAVVNDTLERGSDCAAAMAALLAYDAIIAMRGPIEPQLALLERALDGTGPESVLTARGLQARARHLCQLSRFAEGRADLSRALDIAKQTGATELRASLLLDLGILNHYAHCLDDARRCYEQALVDERATPHPRVEARALSNLAALEHDQRSFDSAAERYEEALAVLESIGDHRQTAQTLTNSALLIQERGDLAEARNRYEAAIERLEQLGDARVRGITLSNLGMLELEEDAPHVAVERHREGQRLLARAGDERSEALCLARLGAAHAANDDIRPALVAFRQSERLVARLDDHARGTVRLFRAFVDFARAREADRDGREGAAAQARRAGKTRLQEAQQPGPDGSPALADKSDDVRAALRILGISSDPP